MSLKVAAITVRLGYGMMELLCLIRLDKYWEWHYSLLFVTTNHNSTNMEYSECD